MQYLGSDRITTWSICRLCSFNPSFTSRCQICDWTNIRGIAVKEGDISAEKCGFSTVTQRILVQSQLWEREGKEGLKLHNLRTDHVTIRSQLRYLIGAKIVDLKCRVFGGNPLQRSGSGSEPDPEPNREFGPVANTNPGDYLRQTSADILSLELHPINIHQLGDFGGRTSQLIPVIKQATSDRLIANCGTVGNPCNLQPYSVGYIMSITIMLAATYSFLTWSELFSPQGFPLLLVIIFLSYSTPAHYGYTTTSPWWERIKYWQIGGGYIKYGNSGHTTRA